MTMTMTMTEGVNAWKPIDTAPRNESPMILLARIVDGEISAIDYGCWEWIENSDYDGAAIYDWSSLRGMEEPTHWTEAPSMEFVIRLNDNGEDDSDEAYEVRTEARKTILEIINE